MVPERTVAGFGNPRVEPNLSGCPSLACAKAASEGYGVVVRVALAESVLGGMEEILAIDEDDRSRIGRCGGGHWLWPPG